jgi:hypothetical protein
MPAGEAAFVAAFFATRLLLYRSETRWNRPRDPAWPRENAKF